VFDKDVEAVKQLILGPPGTTITLHLSPAFSEHSPGGKVEQAVLTPYQWIPSPLSPWADSYSVTISR